MTILDNIYPLGLGTNRFPIKNANDEEGIDLSTQIVVTALKAGINYIDVAHTYSRGMAQEVLRRAIRQVGNFNGVSIKTRIDIDKDIDSVRRRTEDSLLNMGITHAKYFYFWSLFSYKEFEMIIRPGGIYDGALKLKKEGIIDHICFSTHAPVDDIIKILKTQAFEAVTISFSLLNSLRYVKVLETARELNIGVVAMNPLGGGIIPNNSDYFSFACNNEDTNTTEGALRYVLAYKDIQIALSGVSSLFELEQNLKTVNTPTTEKSEQRILRVKNSITELDNFCTGCNYCKNCPVGIPISAIMQCRNSLAFKPIDSNYTFASEEVRQNIYILGKLEQEYSILFDSIENPCIQCGKCECICTQRLNIIDSISDTYKRAQYSNHSRQLRIDKLKSIIDNSPDNIIGIYPAGITSLVIIRFYHENIGELKCKIVQFDSNPAVWGKSDNGIEIYSPDDIPKIKPSTIIITSFKFRDEIYNSIKQYKEDGIKIVKLQDNNELPWLL